MGPCHHGCGSSHLIAKSEGETKKDKGVARSKKHETHAAGIIVKEDIIVLSRRYVGSGIREYGC